MSIFMLYLLFVLIPDIGEWSVKVLDWCFWLFVLSIAAPHLYSLFLNIGNYDSDKYLSAIEKAKPYRKWSLIAGSIALALCVLIPGQEQVYTIAGGYVATNTKGIGKLPENLVGAANDYLEKLRSQIKPAKQD